MKKMFLVICLFLSFGIKAQLPDIIVDRDRAVTTLRVDVQNFTLNQGALFCPDYDTALAQPGQNILITSDLLIANMGHATAVLGTAGVTPGVTYDACRGYNRYDNFCEFAVKKWNGCDYEDLIVNHKAYYETGSGQQYLVPNGYKYAERKAWMQQLCNCTITSAEEQYWLGFPANGGTTQSPAIDIGWCDLYTPGQFGNWVRINNYLGSLTVGDTLAWEIEIYADGVMPEEQRFENTTGLIGFIWDGILTPHNLQTVTLPAHQSTAAIPITSSSVSLNTGLVSVSWTANNTPCTEYTITPIFLKGQIAYTNAIPVTTTGNFTVFTTNNLSAIKQALNIKGAVKCYFDIKAGSGNAVRTTQYVNIK